MGEKFADLTFSKDNISYQSVFSTKNGEPIS